jgi:hypothetical protein
LRPLEGLGAQVSRVPSAPREPGPSLQGGPYREAPPQPEHDADWGGSAILFFVTAPWLMPLWQALRGQDSFGWSAAIGLVLSLSLVVALVRTVASRARSRKHGTP